jgi:RNA polymerase sigma-70 factor, ECF subfamily
MEAILMLDHPQSLNGMIPAHARQMAAEAAAEPPTPTTNEARLYESGSAAAKTHGDYRHDDDGDRKRLRRISCADRDAFEQLYHDYYKCLARFLTRVARNKDDREEIINDAMLVVWQHAGDFRGASRVSTWIFGIAYRCALKSIRRSGYWSRATALEFEDADAMVADSARQAEDRQLLDFALSRLPPKQHLVLILAYRMEFSCEEISAIVKCPVNTVKTRMLHARRKLRTIISAA